MTKMAISIKDFEKQIKELIRHIKENQLLELQQTNQIKW